MEELFKPDELMRMHSEEPSAEPVDFPESFVSTFSDNGLPLPPVPIALADSLRPQGASMFTTTPGWDPGRTLSPEELAAPADGADALLCGFAGHGVASWTYVYCIHRGNMRLAIRIPYPGLYDDREAGLANIRNSYGLVVACAETMAELGRQGDELELALVYSGDVLRYRFVRGADVVSEGDSFESLVRELEKLEGDAEGESVLIRQWV